MARHQEIKDLRKSGRLDEAYTRGKELLNDHPEDRSIREEFGWVLYGKVKKFVEIANQPQASQTDISNKLRETLREYYKLKLSRPALLFSLLLSQILRFSGDLKFLPKFMEWAGTNSFRQEDLETSTSNNGQVFESLVEKAAREVGKISSELTIEDYSDIQELQGFAVTLIDYALERTIVQKPEWLIYRKALLLKNLGKLDEAQSLLISFVQQKRGDFWAWHALAKVIEISDPALALALCSKACLTCKDLNFGVSVFEDLSRLAASQDEKQLAKWSAEQAFAIRNKNEWRIPQSLRNLLNTSWYSHNESVSNPQEELLRVAADAERIIWANYPKYNANYLGTFLTRNEKRMVKFGLLSNAESEELISPERGLLNNISLTFGDPVTVTVDESRDRPTVVVVEKRDSGKVFDSMFCKTGQVHLKQGGFGFMDDIYIPHGLASKLNDEQLVSLAVVKKFDKRKNRWGLAAIAVIDELS